MTARMAGALCLFGLLALQLLWHGWQFPPTELPLGFVLGLALLPLLGPALGLLLARPGALFWGAVVSLFYFCHGVMEAWSSPEIRLLALGEALLAVGLIAAVGVDGWNRRKAARAAAAANL